MVERYEQFSFSISGIYRDIQKIERDEMIKRGYKGAFAQYLAVMRRFPEGVTAAQLCELCDRDKAAVSRVLAEMEEKGLVSRDNSRPYRAAVVLTQEGWELVHYVCSRASVAVAEAGQDLTEEDRKTLYCALERIAFRLQGFCRDGLPEQELLDKRA